MNDNRPDPDALLQSLRREEERVLKGKLKIFFGMCAGVGKTYDMLKAAHEAKGKGIDVVIGYVETHKRMETEELLGGLEIIPRRQLEYRGTILEEMDLDAVLARKPQLALVDELAHTTVPGSRHTKRHMDVVELLDNGIDVYTTLNVQHLESRADTVAQITGSTMRETVPDSIFEQADSVEIIDIPPDELLRRFAEGKVYTSERSQQAIRNFFRKGNLTALREMALRLTAERVDHQLRSYMTTQRITGPWKSGQRFVVGISPSPYSASLIRWARRLAYTMDATWVAVSVEPSTPLGEKAKDQLAKNIKLARELGAEIATTADDDVAHALIHVARQQNASQILVGKPDKIPWFGKDVLEKLIEESAGLDVYVVSGDEDSSREKTKWLRLPEIESGWKQYATAVGTVLAVALLCYPLNPVIGYQTVSLILLFAVTVLPLKLGAGPVLLGAATSALVWDYFFIPPRFTFAINLAQDVLMFGSYFVIAAVGGILSARIRARERAVKTREERASALYSLTKDLAAAGSLDDVAGIAVEKIRKYFDAEVAVFLGQTDGDIFTSAHLSSSMKVDEKEFNVAAWVYWNEKRAGRLTDTLPSATATYYPLSGPRYPLGVIGVRTRGNRKLSFDQEILLENFVSQIASTVEREQLNEISKRTVLLAESERLYKTLFDSISHELRTPIAAIMSASETINNDAVFAAETKKELAGEIHVAAERLNRLVENLLDMTRLESGLIQPKLDWCDIHDLINTTVRKMKKELSRHSVVVDSSSEIPLVKIDFALMEQALANLFLNASQYTPPGSEILVKAHHDGNECVIAISDNGPGLPPELKDKIFEKFYRLPGSMAGGTGLGLSIARGFVEAHKGSIKAERRVEGGTRFTIRLPVEPHAGKEGMV